MTAAAFATQKQVAENGNILKPPNLVTAMGATRCGDAEIELGGGIFRSLYCLEYLARLPFPLPLQHDGGAVNHYIQEATNKQAQKRKKRYVYRSFRHATTPLDRA